MLNQKLPKRKRKVLSQGIIIKNEKHNGTSRGIER